MLFCLHIIMTVLSLQWPTCLQTDSLLDCLSPSLDHGFLGFILEIVASKTTQVYCFSNFSVCR